MRIAFWGTPEYSVNSLKKLLTSEHEIVAVITQPDKKRSRGNKLISSCVKEYAQEKKIQILTPDFLKANKTFITKLKELNCDVFVVIAYGKILSKEILDIPRYGSWNAHASLLPRWRGAAPIQWSILNGDKYTGVGIMKMEVGLDTGDVLIEEMIKIQKEDNLNSLTEKLSKLSSELIIKAMEIIKNNNNCDINFLLKRQIDLNRNTKYARMINKNDYKLNWNSSSIDIYRKVNGLYPRAETRHKGRNLKIIKIEIINKNNYENYTNLFKNKTNPGIVIDIIENKGIIISTNTDPIIIIEGKLEGKKISTKKQLIQQLRPRIGENFSD